MLLKLIYIYIGNLRHNNFSLISKLKDQDQDFRSWIPASVQYILETEDSHFADRIPAVFDYHTSWYNYFEPEDSQVGYLFCIGFEPDNFLDCAEDLPFADDDQVEKNLLTNFSVTRPVYIFKVVKTTATSL